jgi:bifunctional non-homologous end joining protein LigD
VPALARQGAASAVLCAFDLLDLESRDLRREPIEQRKQRLAKLLKGSHLSTVLNEYFEEEGSAVNRAACQLGCEDVVSKGGLARPIGQAAQRIG